MLEIAKLLLPFLTGLLTGGAAGAALTEWFRKRRSRVQRIPLIERVNRQVSPELQEFTVARVVGSSANRQPENVKEIREYQLTLRNTCDLNLRDAQVQFEFPADDVQAWESRPKLSKTPLVEIAAPVKAPWRRAFRWQIPHLPSGDSVEFTFRAVNPSSEDYEASSYGVDGVVLYKTNDEPPLRRAVVYEILKGLFWVTMSLGVVIFTFTFGMRIAESPRSTRPDRISTIKLAGCNLQVTSSSEHSSNGPWFIHHTVYNLGAQACEVQSDKMGWAASITIDPGGDREWARFVESAPKLVDAEISVHITNSPPVTSTVPVYVSE